MAELTTDGKKQDLKVFFDEIEKSIRSIDNQYDFLKQIEHIVAKMDEISEPNENPFFNEAFLNLLRDKIFLFFISRQAFDITCFKLYPLFDPSNLKLSAHQDMSILKNTLLLRYEKLDNLNKQIALLIILLIDILNQYRGEGISDFIARYTDIDMTTKEFGDVLDILDITPDEIVDIYIKSGTLAPNIFMSKDIVTRKKKLLFLLHIWEIFKSPICYNKLYEPLKALFYEAIRSRNTELILYIGFFICFYYENLHDNFTAWKMLDKEIKKPMSDFFVQYCRDNHIKQCDRTPEKGKKIKVGYADRRLLLSSPMCVLLSLVQGHFINKNPDMEFYVYGYDYKEQIGDSIEIINYIKSMGFECISAGELGNFDDFYYSHFEKAMALRRRIIEDGIDILITTGTSIDNFLVSSRVAPIQIYWSHINPYWSVNNLDYRIIHASVDSVIKGFYHDVEYFRFPAPMAKEFLNPPVSDQAIEHVRKKFPEGKTILGFIGRLVKAYSSDYLFAVSEILRRNPDTIFLFCGSGEQEPIRKYFEKVGCIDRVYFEGHVSPHVYGHIIDIAINSFPTSMGNAANEFLAKGKPVVSMISPFSGTEEIRDFILKAKKDKIGGEIWADSTEEYIRIAGDFIKDKDYRDKVGKKEQEIIRRIYDCQKSASQLETLFISLAERKS